MVIVVTLLKLRPQRTRPGAGPPRRRRAAARLPAAAGRPAQAARDSVEMLRLRRNGVNTNGAAAKVMNFDRLGKKVCPATFGKIQVG